MKGLSVLLLIFFVVACGDDRLPRVETLDQFRVLGIVATTPEVAPGGSTNVRVLVSDVAGGGRTINGTYTACIDPGISVGAEANCNHDSTAVDLPYNVDTTIADFSSNLFTGLGPTVNVTVPALIFTGRNSRDQFNGIGYIVVFTFTVDGKEVKAFKRIIATNRGALNTNPSGGQLLCNGSLISGIPGKDDTLNVANLTPQTYSYINVDGSTETRTEELEVAWFVSNGKVDKPKASYGDGVKYLDDQPSSLLLVAVIRDGRGGTEVLRYFQ